MNNHDKIHNFNHKFIQMSCETCLCSEDWVNTNWREQRRRFLSLNWEQSADPVMEWKGDELIIQHLLNSFIKSSVRPREPSETYPAKLVEFVRMWVGFHKQIATELFVPCTCIFQAYYFVYNWCVLRTIPNSHLSSCTDNSRTVIDLSLG